VVEASRLLFGGTDLAAVGGDVLAVLADEIPSARVTAVELAALGAADALVKVGLASSKGDARRGIQGKGFSLNGVHLADGERRLSAADLLAGRYVMLQKGKRNFALLVIEG
jgi:tyrosyl-tRNA synthetase